MKKILTILIVSSLLTSTIFADQSKSSANSPRILPINSSPFGQSYADWVIDFSRWVYSIPSDVNPFVPGNLNCTRPQHGKVWYIGTNTGDPRVKCEIPEGKAIFLHVGAYIDTWPCPDPSFKPVPGQTLEEFLKLDAKKYVPTPKELEIDGKPFLSQDDALKQSLSTRLFSFTGDLSLKTTLDSCVTGKLQKAVADGYWVMLVGLERGKHTFSFSDGTLMKVTIIKN